MASSYLSPRATSPDSWFSFHSSELVNTQYRPAVIVAYKPPVVAIVVFSTITIGQGGACVVQYLILVRRARNAKKWSRFFRALLEGRYAGVSKAFTAFLELAIEWSTVMPGESLKEIYTKKKH